MKYDDWLERGADGLLGGVIAGVILLCYLVSCLGCATTKCPPCIPEVEIVEVLTPVLSCPPPPAIPSLSMPEWPEVPTAATADSIKAFYADVVSTLKARERILLERLEVLEKILGSYRIGDDSQ